ncbi:MAG: molybdopterin molybdotransferase MoeA [Anaerolineae bacterium]|nr:molybdopterin molybdotransferase MoeA [Anaerolineae bacterium]
MISKQFFAVQPIDTTLANLFQNIKPLEKSEMLQTIATINRVLITPLQSPIDLPAFHRSTMDGYAVKAADTFGATDALPSYLQVIGQVHMGEVPSLTIQSGEAAEIHTGAMIPSGADAVVMIERTQLVGTGALEVLAPVAHGENIIQLGEDIEKDSEALPVGHRIRPQDIGGLLAVGIQEVEVMQKPRIAILSCGDELVEVQQTPQLGQIRDINSYMLMALCHEMGADAVRLGIARDTLDSLSALARQGLAEYDMLILSAGSSVSTRDLTYDVVNELGKPGILQHGLAVKPGKPTIVAACDGKPVIGLPGNPVSAMLVARQVLVPIIRYLLGEAQKPIATVGATLIQNIASTSGREDSIPVRLHKTDIGHNAEPIWGKSNLIYTLLKADGLIHVPLNTSGYPSGTLVDVRLF